MPTKTRLQKYRDIFPFAAQQLRLLITTHPDRFPMYTLNGRWSLEGEAWTNWCEGFLGGQLWLISQYDPDPWFRQQAEHYTCLIEHRKQDRSVHDLGFLFWSTWKRWYNLSGDQSINQVVIQAGQTLALRFKENGRYLRSFLAENSIFIDIMMNVGIIFYAAQQTNDQALYQIALEHCLTSRRVLVRGDGSTSHEGLFDTQTGQFIGQSTQQGWRSDSCWARGLAWAIYGFTTVFNFTSDERFLHTAEACADYYLSHAPTNGIPPNDFDEPNPMHLYESSAAAIAASGLLDLAGSGSTDKKRREYRKMALTILDTLTTHEFTASHTPGWEGILKHGMYHQRKGLGVNESVMWGDYFFLEALDKVLRDG